MADTTQIRVDFTKKAGKIKPMNAGNNGPLTKHPDQTCGNFDTFKMLHIPYARVHDANFHSSYGEPFTIDVRAIFQDWNADPEDPASYDFLMTDQYLRTIEAAGAEPYYRLGGRIEHEAKKYFTCVPPDFQKFAVVCEHIIRHCTGDWANGLNMKITYWEIWNEADMDYAESKNKRNWQGTPEQFYEMFCITFKHLKKCFPHLKIGGPASCDPICDNRPDKWTDHLFMELEKNDIKLDFYSWHRYACEVTDVFHWVREVRKYLDTHGQSQAESILNEWNYVKGWSDAWVYSLEREADMKGAAFVLCTILGCQKLPLDLLMYYDMRAHCGMNGLWHSVSFDIQKPWYPFFMFDKLAQLGTEVESESGADENVQVVGAIGEDGRKAAVIGLYTDDDNFGVRTLAIELKGLSEKEKANLTVRLLDDKTDCFEIPFNLEGDVITFPNPVRARAGLLIQC